MLMGLGNTDREPTYEIFGPPIEEGQDVKEGQIGFQSLRKWKGDWRGGRLNYYQGPDD